MQSVLDKHGVVMVDFVIPQVHWVLHDQHKETLGTIYTLGGAASLDANAGKQGKAGLNLKTFEPSGIKARR